MSKTSVKKKIPPPLKCPVVGCDRDMAIGSMGSGGITVACHHRYDLTDWSTSHYSASKRYFHTDEQYNRALWAAYVWTLTDAMKRAAGRIRAAHLIHTEECELSCIAYIATALEEAIS